MLRTFALPCVTKISPERGKPAGMAVPAGFSLPRCFGNGNELDWQRTVTMLIRYCSGSASKQFRRGFQRHAPGLMFFELCAWRNWQTRCIVAGMQPCETCCPMGLHLMAGLQVRVLPRTIQRTSSEQCPASAQARQAAQTARDNEQPIFRISPKP